MTNAQEALLDRARRGDEDAFGELHREHAGFVRSTVLGILRGPDVEDVCQETFLQAFLGLDGFAGTCTFRSWITRIALNQCFMKLRGRKFLKSGEVYQVDLESEDLDKRVFASEDVQLRSVGARVDVERLFAELGVRDVRLLSMAYLEGMPISEIAGVLGVSRSAVRNRLARARRRARRV